MRKFGVLAATACLWAGPAAADAVMSEAKDFSAVTTAIEGFGPGALAKTLIVMDDDDTLTKMTCTDQSSPATCQYIGGPAWYSWQGDLVKNDPTSNFAVAQDEGGLLDVAAFLLAANKMPYVQDEIPTILGDLVRSGTGAKLLVLTARGGANISATEMQFGALTYQGGANFLQFISANALNGSKSGIPSVAGPVTPVECGATRDVSYRQGVMYVAGQNKGDMLKCLLDWTESSHIENIVFIDDTAANVVDVFTAFEDSTDYTVRALHYTYLQAHKHALTSDPMFQEAAEARWEALRYILDLELIAPAVQ